jgi:hypothetical protein
MLQQPGSTYSPPQTLDLGAGEGPVGADSFNQGVRNTWTSNNLFHTFRSAAPSIIVAAGGVNNSFDYDLYNCCLENDTHAAFTEPNGVHGVPTYKTGHGWMAFPQLSSAPSRDAVFGPGLGVGIGNFQLQSTAPSPGLNAGTPLPNFAVDIDNVALARKSGVAGSGNPDLGAHDSESPDPMRFGVTAGQ